MRVKELMSQPVRTCAVTESADRAAMIMWEGDCGTVPVVDETGVVVGVVTDRDLCMAALFHGTALRDIPIADAMANNVYTCGPDDDVLDAERLMSVRQIRRLPVVEASGRPVGILSVSDVVQQVTPATRPLKSQSASDDCLRTLAAISEPRSKLQTVAPM